MTEEDFVETNDGAAVDDETLANWILDTVQEDELLWHLADAFLEAQTKFRDHLDDLGFEFG